MTKRETPAFLPGLGNSIFTSKTSNTKSLAAAQALNRQVFKTSRLAEFCSRKEPTNQTGHSSEEWPLVLLKELVDNAIDACEEAFRLFARSEKIRQVVEDAIDALENEQIDVSDGLEQRVRDYLEDNPEKPWTEAVRHIADEEGE